MLQTSSTTDSVEEINRAYAAIGLEPETVEVYSNEEEPVIPATEVPAAEQPLPEQQTGDEAKPATESGTAEQPPQETPGKPEKKGNLQKRFDEMTAERVAAQKLADDNKRLAEERSTRIAELERQLEEKSKPAEPKPEAKVEPIPPPVAETQPKPKQEDFPEYTDYLEAVADWKVDQATARIAAQHDAKIQELEAKLNEKERVRSVQDERAMRVEESIAIGRQKYADWDTLAKDPESANLPFAPALLDALHDAEAEERADVTHYLVTHRDEAKALDKLIRYPDNAPAHVILKANRVLGQEIARMKLAIQAEAEPPEPKTPPVVPPAPPKTKVTAAPPPITPIRGAGTAPGNPATPYEKPMSFKEYQAWHDRRNK